MSWQRCRQWGRYGKRLDFGATIFPYQLALGISLGIFDRQLEVITYMGPLKLWLTATPRGGDKDGR